MKLLDNIDKYFYEKSSKKELYYTLGLITFVLGFIIYYYIFPMVKQFNINSKNQYDNLISTIQRDKIQLNILRARNIQLQKKLQTLNKRLKELKKEKMFFDELTNLMDFAEFNRARWAEFVKNIIMDAKTEGLKVELVENKVYNENDKKEFNKLPSNMIVKKMSIALDLSGNYINFIHFIYKYEDRKDLIRVEEIKIKDRKHFYVKFTLYGYER